MTNEIPSDAAAEWEATKQALQAAYKMLDSARERESKDRDHHGKLLDTIRMQASALAEKSKEKSGFRNNIEYLILLVILALAAQLLYLAHQLQLLLG